MTNRFYSNTTNTILDGTIADSSDVENKCDDIASAFDFVAGELDPLNSVLPDCLAARDAALNAAAENSIVWSVHTSDHVALADERLVLDTAGGSFNITLPASPEIGNVVYLKTNGSAAQYPASVLRNGSKILGLEENLTMDKNFFEGSFVYTGTTNGWIF